MTRSRSISSSSAWKSPGTGRPKSAWLSKPLLSGRTISRVSFTPAGRTSRPLSPFPGVITCSPLSRCSAATIVAWRPTWSLHDVSPLGAGALAGSTLPLDPDQTARSLGFKEAFRNSYDVVGDRDFILELLQIATQIMIHASRLAEDFVYMSSTAVGWIELPDALCTGSSMMPQKKNPDVMELARGKTATVLGHATGLAALLKGLPSSYNRDLQQDKEHLFPAVSITGDTLDVLPLVVGGFQVANGAHCASVARGLSHGDRPGRVPGSPRLAVQGRA